MKYISDACIRVMLKLREENGQTIVEYALIIVLLVLVVIAAMAGIGRNTNNAYCCIISSFR